MTFTGFSRETLGFLGKLSRNNNRDWFHKNRPTYEAELLEPAKDFVVAMGRYLNSISPDIQADPRVNASIRRIARDTRFNPDKAPYKDHLDLFFVYAGSNKEGPGYFLRIMQKGLGIGVGTHVFDKSKLVRFRNAVADPTAGKTLTTTIKKLEKSGYKIAGSHYKRVPRGFDPEHERADLLKHAGLYAYTDQKLPEAFFTPRFPEFCTRHFKKMSALGEWLRKNV